MKVLIVEPGKYPREADIEHTLEAEQAVVGGTIEAVYPWRDSACIVCNDNGIAENLPLNRMLGDYDIIHGTFFVCGLTSNDFTDLTPQQMKRYEELYHDPQLFFLLGKTLCVEHTTPEEYARVMAPPPSSQTILLLPLICCHHSAYVSKTLLPPYSFSLQFYFRFENKH